MEGKRMTREEAAEQQKHVQSGAGIPTTHICPVCSTPLESRGGFIRVIIGKHDIISGIQGASWYCAECDRVWDYGDLPCTQSDTQQPKNIPLHAELHDDCDRLRWILNRAERAVRVEDADRAAVDRACLLMAEIDNGFDRVRG
jgi:hypothetical protein